MSQRRIHPRPEQVAELTRGLVLPLPPLHEVHLKFVAEVLALAWTGLMADYQTATPSGIEAEANSLMASRLNALRDENNLWAQMVSNVGRGEESISFDGSHLEKRPDLSLHLTTRSASFPLIVECKIIDDGEGKKINLYCEEGLLRFVRGEYGWGTCEAFMLAYVRDKSTIEASLCALLRKNRKLQPDRYLTESLPEAVLGKDMRLARSMHNREFLYLGQSHGPGTIAIWHLWVDGRTDV